MKITNKIKKIIVGIFPSLIRRGRGWSSPPRLGGARFVEKGKFQWNARIKGNGEIRAIWGGRNRRYLLVGFFVALVVIILSFVLFRNSEQAKAEWFNDSWHYRQTAVVANTGPATTNQYVKITLDTSALITASKMQSDCDDLRVTDYSGNLLPYFIDGDTAYDCNETDTAIYTRLSSITKDDSNVFLYYGNVSADNNEVVLGSFEEPALSCKNILEHGNSNGNGNYYITPSGNLADKIQVYCDMTYSSGGWILVFHGLPTEAMVLDTTNEKVKLSNNIIFNDIRMEGVNTNFHVSTTVTETAQLSSTIPQYYYEVDQAADATSPRVNFHDLDGNQDVLLTSNYFLFGYGNSWRVFYTCIYVDSINYIYIGGYSPTCTPRSSFVSTDVGCSGTGNQYCANARTTTPADTGLGLSLYEYQETKTWVRENDLVLNTDQSANAPADEEIGGGPVGYWKFDEGYGTTAYDSSSYKNNGTLTNMSTTGTSTAWQIGKVGKALMFDGNNDRVVINSTNLNYNSQMSWSFWIKPINVVGDDYFYGVYTSSPENRVYFWDDDGILKYTFGAANETTNTNVALTNNQWHYLTFVYNGTNLTTYHNGQRVHQFDRTFTGIGTTHYIGTYTGLLNFFSGLIDEPKIYNYALTASQILAEYNQGKSVILSQTPEQVQNSQEGLVGYWKMDESITAWDGAGDRVNDYSGNGNNGTAVGTAHATTTAKYGNSGEFDGDSDYVNCGSGSSLSMSQQFTLEVWVNQRSSTGYQTILNHGGQNASGEYWLYLSNGKISLEVSNGVLHPYDEALSSAIGTGWHHVAVSFEQGKVKAYLDGSLTKQTTFTISDLTATARSLIFGSYASPAYYLNGLLDDVKIYNIARTPDQIMQDYLTGPGPVAYYDFNEGSGTTLYDKSGNGNNSSSFSGGLGVSSDWVKGKYGRALDFDGDDDKITISHNAMLEPASVSVSIWVKLQNNNARHVLFTKWNGYTMEVNSDKTFKWGLNGPTSQYFGTQKIDWNKWYHLVGTFDQTTKSQCNYINGIRTECQTVTGSISYNQASLIISGDWDNSKGVFDEAKLFNYALTPWQVAQEYNQGDPIAQWSFDEGYGTSVYNTYATSTGALTGTLGGMSTTGTSTAWQVGKVGKALMFDGINDSISFGNKNAISMSGDFSLSVWFKIPQYLGAEMVIMNKGVYLTSGFRFGIYSNKFGFWTTEEGGNISVNTKNNVSLNTWHHGVVTYSGGNVNLYFDGSKAASQSNGTYTANTSGNLTVGTVYGAWPYQGLIDEVKIYNYALSPAQIKKDYNDNASVVMGTADGGQAVQQGLVAWYKMDEATTTWDGAGDRINDYSGNNYTGTAYGHAHATSTARYGNSGEFDGTDDYVNFGNLNYISTGVANEFTVGLWMYPHSASGAQWIFGDEVSSNLGLMIETSSGVIVDYFPSTSYISTGYTPTLNTWTFITMRQDKNGVDFYANGTFYKHLTNLLHQETSATTYSGLWAASSRAYNGLIDDIKVYNYARTEGQIMQDYLVGPGPVAYYDFNEGQGTTLNDKSGWGNNSSSFGGGLGASSDWVRGKYGTSLDFDGNDSATVTNSSSITFGTNNDFTITTWIKPSTITYYRAVVGKGGQDNSTAGYQLFTSTSGAGITFRLTWLGGPAYGVSVTKSGLDLDDGKWHFVVAVVNRANDTAYIYVDNLSATTGDISSVGNTSSSANLTIGTGGAGAYYGFIDEVKIFNYTLTPWQIAQEYNGGAPIGYWKMDEGQGGSIYDWSGNSYHGSLSLNGSPATSTAWQTSTNCKINGCLDFDGTDDYVEANNVGSLNSGGSLTAWIKMDAGGANQLIAANIYSSSARLVIGVKSNNILAMNMYDGSSHGRDSGNTTLAVGTWYFVAATNDGTNQKVYINGKDVSSGTTIANSDSAVNKFRIGKREGGTEPFNGKIDDARIYNYALSPAQISEVYNMGFGTYFK